MAVEPTWWVPPASHGASTPSNRARSASKAELTARGLPLLIQLSNDFLTRREPDLPLAANVYRFRDGEIAEVWFHPDGDEQEALSAVFGDD